MSEERATSRRALLASLLVAAPAAANAMAVPGFNSPGLVPAKKVPRNPTGYSGDNFAQIRDAETNHFWSPQGVSSLCACISSCTPSPTLCPAAGCCSVIWEGGEVVCRLLLLLLSLPLVACRCGAPCGCCADRKARAAARSEHGLGCARG